MGMMDALCATLEVCWLLAEHNKAGLVWVPVEGSGSRIFEGRRWCSGLVEVRRDFNILSSDILMQVWQYLLKKPLRNIDRNLNNEPASSSSQGGRGGGGGSECFLLVASEAGRGDVDFHARTTS